MKRWRTEDVQGSETALSDAVMMGTCHYTFVQSHRMSNTESKPSCKPWTFPVIIMCQCRFVTINCNKCAPCVSDADSGGSCGCVGAGGIWETSVPTSQFCCESKTPLKNEVFKKKKKRRGEGTLLHRGGPRRGCGMALQLPLILTMCGVLGGQAGHFITSCLRKCLPALHLPF